MSDRPRRDERPWSDVSRTAALLFALGIVAQVSLHAIAPAPVARAADLGPPPGVRSVVAASLGDPLAGAKFMNLLLQAHDNQPGVSIPFRDLDYRMVERWLARILDIDPKGQYPLLAASRLYGEVADPARQRLMLDFVHQQFFADPARRWPALAHAVYVARHGLGDLELARTYARSLREHATGPTVPAWAKQMEIFLLADMNQAESARVLLGGLLSSGEVADPSEYRFLAGRLAELEAVTRR